MKSILILNQAEVRVFSKLIILSALPGKLKNSIEKSHLFNSFFYPDDEIARNKLFTTPVFLEFWITRYFENWEYTERIPDQKD